MINILFQTILIMYSILFLAKLAMGNQIIALLSRTILIDDNFLEIKVGPQFNTSK